MGLFDGLARESTYISAIARTLIGMRGVKPDSTHTIVDIVEAQARATPQAIAFYYLRFDHDLSQRSMPAPTASHIGLARPECGAAMPWRCSWRTGPIM